MYEYRPQQYTEAELNQAVEWAMLTLIEEQHGPFGMLTQRDFSAILDKTFERLYRYATGPTKGLDSKMLGRLVAEKICIVRP